MSTKKSDLKSDLTDLLMGNEDLEKSISKALDSEPVTIGSPDQTELFRKKREKALQEQKDRESKKIETAPLDLPPIPNRTPSSSAAAQTRIEQLEAQVDGLRSENQKLETSSDALRAQVEEMSKRLVEWETRYRGMVEKKDLELQLSREEVGHRSTKLEQAQKHLEELELRFENEFKRIRVRERELQNRLEILKHEGGAVSRNKDDLILDLKRQIEKMGYEVDTFRKKNQSVYSQVEAQHDRIKRAMKALRVAVSLLDGQEDKVIKKAE